jgi:hypothetical protein
MGEAKRKRGAVPDRVRYVPVPVLTKAGWVWVTEKGQVRRLVAGPLITEIGTVQEARGKAAEVTRRLSAAEPPADPGAAR